MFFTKFISTCDMEMVLVGTFTEYCNYNCTSTSKLENSTSTYQHLNV